MKGDVFYFPTPEGVYLRNNQGSFHMKGKGIALLLDVLLPYLDGQQTLEEILQQAPTERRELISRLIQMLAARGFIRDVTSDRPHQLSAAELETYAAEIAFIEAFSDSSAWRFERYRSSRVLLIGSGLTLQALVQAALQSGLADIHVLITDECPLERSRLQEYLELRRTRDPRQTLHLLSPLNWEDEAAVEQALAPFEAVLHISDRPMLARSALLNRLCYRQGRLFLTATIIEGEAWLGPLVRAEKGVRPGCWECAWRRLQANLPLETASTLYNFADRPEAAISYLLAAPTAAVVANVLHFELLKSIAGAGPLETAGHLLAIDLETLQSKRHPFKAAPSCRCCATARPLTAEQFCSLLRERSAGPVLSQEEFSKAAAQLFDEKLGLFSALDEYDYTQIPLNIARVDLARPSSALSLHTRERLRVFGAGSDFGMARREATLRACERYAASCYAAERSLRGCEAERLAGEEAPLVCYTRTLEPCATTQAQELYLWAWELPGERPVLLPAAVVFALSAEADLGQQAPCGVAAGMSWSEALCRALFTHAQAQLAERLATSREPFPRVKIGELALSAAALRYLHLLELQGITIAIYDLSALLVDWRLAAFAFCYEEETWACTCHLQARAAIEEGLLLCLQQAQARHNGEPDYAPPAAPVLPAALRGEAEITPQYPDPASWTQMQETLLATLQARGERALIVPLDHDAALSAALPYIVRVMLGRINDGSR